MKGSKCSRLSAVALGIAFGVTTALTMIALGWFAWVGGYGTQVVDQWATMFPGFGASIKGALMGGMWGFIQGFLFGLISGWIYNLCLGCCPSKKSCCCGKPSCPCCSGNEK